MKTQKEKTQEEQRTFTEGQPSKQQEQIRPRAPDTDRREPPHRPRRSSPWLVILLMLMSMPLLIGGIGLLIFAGVAFAFVTVLLLAVGLGLLVAAGIFFVVSIIRVETRHFSVSANPQIVINNDIGTIHVNASSDANEVTIQTTTWNKRFARAPVRYEQSEEGDALAAQVDRTSVSNITSSPRVDFDVTAPRNTELKLTTNSGDIWVTGISGQLSLSSNTGSITIRRGVLSGVSRLTTNEGAINFHEETDPCGSYHFVTETGPINVNIPGNAAILLDVSTKAGTIKANAPGVTITHRTGHKLYGIAGEPPCARLTLRSSTGSINLYEESNDQSPHWKEIQSRYASRRNMRHSVVVGGLSGGIFFFGLAFAILSGHFWPMLFATLALTSLVGSLSKSNLQTIYGGFQGFVFFLGLALCSVIGWWPWILVVLGISSVLGTLSGVWYRKSQREKLNWF